MRILGIDYGKKKVGISMATSKLASPYKVIKNNGDKELVDKISTILDEKSIEKVVIGLSEGSMAKETTNFANKLKKAIHCQIVFQDETLTTHDANKLAIEAGLRRKKRRDMEDAFSAALILQLFLDKNG
jgi:putative Holliday junction resolvase